MKGMEWPKKFGEMLLLGKGRPDQEKGGYGQSGKQLDATFLCFGCNWSSHLSLDLEDPSLGESLAISVKGQQLRDWLVNTQLSISWQWWSTAKGSTSLPVDSPDTLPSGASSLQLKYLESNCGLEFISLFKP